LVTEQNNHQATRATLLTTQNNLTQATQDLNDAQGDTVAANNQLLTVQQELEGAEVGELADMACPTFSGRQLDDALQHSRNVKYELRIKSFQLICRSRVRYQRMLREQWRRSHIFLPH